MCKKNWRVLSARIFPRKDVLKTSQNNPLMISIKHKRCKILDKDAVIIDVTSKSTSEYKALSPFTLQDPPIEIPGIPGMVGASVEQIWQNLKVFHDAPADLAGLGKPQTRGVKRTKRTFGDVMGHYQGPNKPLLGIVDARRQIYIPCYDIQLDRNKELIDKIKALVNAGQHVILLDYATNEDVEVDKPLSHAGLVKKRVLGA